MFEARGITVQFGAKKVLKTVDAALAGGEVVALCGPNGAGKSTLLGAMAGDVSPQAGGVFLDGEPLRDMSAPDLASRRAVLEQYPTLGAPFTVYELLALSIPHDVPPKDVDPLIQGTLAAADLLDQMDSNCLTLSGGQRHRAHLARVLVQLGASRAAQTYLLLDEPTASLDLAHQIATLRIARQTAKSGTGVLIILHDLNLASAYADRVILMCAGGIVANGPPDEILTEERLSAVYETRINVQHQAGQRPRILPVYN